MLSETLMIEPILSQTHNPQSGAGSKDGDGCGDHDQPYRFGRRPTSSVPFPFNERQFVRLLILRSKIHASAS
jgi:hypothetical protein